MIALAIWRLEDAKTKDASAEINSCHFMAGNHFFFAVLGMICSLPWPRKKVEEEGKGATIAQPAQASEAKPAEVTTGKAIENGAAVEQAIDIEPPKPPKKRNTVYLTNLKTFLTVIVVVFHVSGYWSKAGYNLLFLGELPWGKGPDFFKTNAVADEGGVALRAYLTIAVFFEWMTQSYFMSAFFMISAFFCPKSYNRKGFKSYIVDKLVRLGGPYLLYCFILGPVNEAIVTAHVSHVNGQKQEFEWVFQKGVTWFILWLLNLSVVYGLYELVKQRLFPKLKFTIPMPHPLILTPCFGVVCGYIMWASCKVWRVHQQGYAEFGGMALWEYGMGTHITFFVFGIFAGCNNWLPKLEEMKMWVAWVLRLYTLAFIAYFFCAYSDLTIPLRLKIERGHQSETWTNLETQFAVSMTFVWIQLFYQYFNKSPQSKIARNAGVAAYGVYITHVPLIMWYAIIYVEILRASGVEVRFSDKHFQMFYQVDEGSYLGGYRLVQGGYVWAGYLSMNIFVNLISWPGSFYMRKLPILNRML